VPWDGCPGVPRVGAGARPRVASGRLPSKSAWAREPERPCLDLPVGRVPWGGCPGVPRVGAGARPRVASGRLPSKSAWAREPERLLPGPALSGGLLWGGCPGVPRVGAGARPRVASGRCLRGRPGLGSRSAFAWALPSGGVPWGGALGFGPRVGAGARPRDRRLGAGAFEVGLGSGAGAPLPGLSRRAGCLRAVSSHRMPGWWSPFGRSAGSVLPVGSNPSREPKLPVGVSPGGGTSFSSRRHRFDRRANPTGYERWNRLFHTWTFPALRRSAKRGRVDGARSSGERLAPACRAGSWAPGVHHPAATSRLESFSEEQLFTAGSSPLDQGRTWPVGGEPHLRGEPRGWRNGARVCASSPRGLCRGIGPWGSVPKGEPPGVVGKLVPAAVWVPPPGKGRGR
jgi:hypothetical protein